MKARINHFNANPKVMQAMLTFSEQSHQISLEKKLIELVKVRASQINGCAFCLHMHTRDGRAAGESETRYYLLDAWQESPLYSPRERAALAWTEALTRLSEATISDEDFAAVRDVFSEREVVELTLLVVTINVWNRFGVAFRPIHPVEPEIV